MMQRGVRVAILTTMAKICSRICKENLQEKTKNFSLIEVSTYRLIDCDTRWNDEIIRINESVQFDLNEFFEIWDELGKNFSQVFSRRCFIVVSLEVILSGWKSKVVNQCQ